MPNIPLDKFIESRIFENGIEDKELLPKLGNWITKAQRIMRVQAEALNKYRTSGFYVSDRQFDEEGLRSYTFAVEAETEINKILEG